MILLVVRPVRYVSIVQRFQLDAEFCESKAKLLRSSSVLLCPCRPSRRRNCPRHRVRELARRRKSVALSARFFFLRPPAAASASLLLLLSSNLPSLLEGGGECAGAVYVARRSSTQSRDTRDVPVNRKWEIRNLSARLLLLEGQSSSMARGLACVLSSRATVTAEEKEKKVSRFYAQTTV